MKLELKNKLAIPLATAALVASAATGFVAIANADTTTASNTTASATQDHARPTAMGKITAISGSTITLTDERAGTTYTVDASGATVTKHEAPTTQGAQPTSTTESVSDLAVGDMIAVTGTKDGSNITATSIETGMGMMGGRGGHPGVMGTVSAVSGSTITVTSKDGTTYIVDASKADTTKMETISVSDIRVGDTVGVEGTKSGSTVTATHIMDGQLPRPSTTTSAQ